MNFDQRPVLQNDVRYADVFGNFSGCAAWQQHNITGLQSVQKRQHISGKFLLE